MAALADFAAGRRRADGIDELPDNERYLYAIFQRLRAWDVWQAATLSVALRRSRRLAGDPGMESDLVEAFPLRPDGVGLALAHAMGATADEVEAEYRGGSATNGLIRCNYNHSSVGNTRRNILFQHSHSHKYRTLLWHRFCPFFKTIQRSRAIVRIIAII